MTPAMPPPITATSTATSPSSRGKPVSATLVFQNDVGLEPATAALPESVRAALRHPR